MLTLIDAGQSTPSIDAGSTVAASPDDDVSRPFIRNGQLFFGPFDSESSEFGTLRQASGQSSRCGGGM